MHGLRFLTTTALALALVGAANTAAAAVVSISWSGTVRSGSDFAGDFGVASSDLTGKTFSFTEIIDDSVAYQKFADGNSSQASGGPRDNGSPRMGAGVLTINGVRQNLSGWSNSQIYSKFGAEITTTLTDQDYNHGSTINNTILMDLQCPGTFCGPSIPGSYTQAVSLNASAGYTANSNFQLWNFDANTGTYDRLSSGYFNVDQVTVTPLTKFKITWTGTLRSGTDTTGDFGAAGADLTGKAFTFVETVDDSVAYQKSSNGSSSDAFGGPRDYGTPVMTSGVLTINGISQSLAGRSNSDIYSNFSAELSSTITDQDYNHGSTINNSIFMDLRCPANVCGSYISANYSDALSVDASAGYTAGSNFQLWDFNAGTGTYAHLSSGYFNIDQVTVTPPSVPEPATWSLMLAGVGGMGAALRARRRQHTPRPASVAGM